MEIMDWTNQFDFGPNSQETPFSFASSTQTASASSAPMDSLFANPPQLESPQDSAQTPSPQANPADGQMAPPATKPRKRKAPTLPDDDWEPYKSHIIELHINDNLPLSEVRDKLETKFGFKAELRQYRFRISKWGLDKKVKPHEYQAIVRKRQRRKLVDTHRGELAFTVRGVEVDNQKIERWMKGRGISDHLPYALIPAASTPSAIDCETVLGEQRSPFPSTPNSTASRLATPTPATPSMQSRVIGTPVMALASPFSASYGEPPLSPALSDISVPRGPSSFGGQSPAPDNGLPVVWMQNLAPITPVLTNWAVSPPLFSEPRFPLVAGQTSHQMTAQPMPQRYLQANEDSLRDAIRQLEVIHGPHHFDTLAKMLELGVVLAEQGRFKSAEEITRSVIDAHPAGVGTTNLMIEALDQLGIVFSRQGRFSESLELFSKTFKTKTRRFGSEDPRTLLSMQSLADAYVHMDRLKKAEDLIRELMEICMRVFGNRSEKHTRAVYSLALSYHAQKRWGECELLSRQVIDVWVPTVGNEHRNTFTAKCLLAATYWEQGRWSEAGVLQLQVVTHERKNLGKEHPRTLMTMSRLVGTYMKVGRWTEAETLGLEVREAQERVLGKEHPDTLYSLHMLAELYLHQSRWEDARSMSSEVLEAMVKRFGKEHRDTLASARLLRSVYHAQGLEVEARSVEEKYLQG
ncbi:hypothetical protein B0H63DRAFT_441076 [Podospora didyma]|uniref:Clr5 domain-containing protein n=1 Tax=Podospora didyma TaxID=330526 RepID=A0AAE0N578_9PEZI|nr:hypothetical protein B0H63DRAFT_441076 [Podospora didyma]